MSSLLVQSPFKPVSEPRFSQPVPMSPPRIAMLSEVIPYLEKRFPDAHHEDYRAKLCTGLYECDPWLVEPILLADLQQALRDDNKEEALRIRKYLRAVSWYLHEPFDLDQLISFCDDTLPSPDDDVVKASLRKNARGAEMEPAVLVIERALLHAYLRYGLAEHDLERLAGQGTPDAQQAQTKRSEALADLHKLRAVRDQLYFQALYQGWYLPEQSPT